MPRTFRQRRGQATAVLAAAYLRRRLAPDAEATSSAYAGNDMQHVPWDVEVKAPRERSWEHKAKGADHPAEPTIEPVFCRDCGEPVLERSRFSPLAALRQAAKRRRPDHILPPMVVLRPDGVGDQNVGQFVVMRFFEDDEEILAELFELRRMWQLMGATARRMTLEYTDAHGGLMSTAARAELEEFRAQDG